MLGVGEGGERADREGWGRKKGAAAAQHATGSLLPLPSHMPKGTMGVGGTECEHKHHRAETGHPHTDLPIKYIIYLLSDVSS